jgi:hypothetical protein
VMDHVDTNVMMDVVNPTKISSLSIMDKPPCI